MLENVLNNAIRHGHPDDPEVCVSAELIPLPDAADPHDPRRELRLRVTNRADPSKAPVTAEVLRRALEGQGAQSFSVSQLSDGMGLQHTCMAAHTLGMALSLTQVGDRVVFEATAETQVCRPSAPQKDRATALSRPFLQKPFPQVPPTSPPVLTAAVGLRAGPVSPPPPPLLTSGTRQRPPGGGTPRTTDGTPPGGHAPQSTGPRRSAALSSKSKVPRGTCPPQPTGDSVTPRGPWGTRSPSDVGRGGGGTPERHGLGG